MTKIRLGLASVIYFFLKRLGLGKPRLISRGGVRYEVDPREGIDLSLLLFGGFQGNVLRAFPPLGDGGVLLDIGANVGTFCLPAAKMFPGCRVYAFEPTRFAFEKLKRNISLNEALGKRVFPAQAFLLSDVHRPLPGSVYARWPLAGREEKLHPLHGGAPESTSGALVTTVDQFVGDKKLNRIDGIKIDTDGAEDEVLRGARDTLARFRPWVVFEAGKYLWKEKGLSAEKLIEFFNSVGYAVTSQRGSPALDAVGLSRVVPERYTVDLLAVPVGGERGN